MKRAIYPLYAPADANTVKPILDALKQEGVTVRDGGANIGKGDALLLFLSSGLQADSPAAETFFRYNEGRELIIPVNLDGCTPPADLQSALMARHSLDGRKYTGEEMASLIAKALEGKNRLPLILSVAAAAILLAVGILIYGKNRPQTVEIVAAEDTPAPTAEPTAEPTPAPTEAPHVEGIEVDLESVAELVIVGDRLVYFTWDQGYNKYQDKDSRRNEVAYGTWQDDSPHYFSKEDGSEIPRTTYDDLSFISLFPNLKYLTLCLADATLPDLSGLDKLRGVSLQYCDVGDLSWLRGSGLYWFEYQGGSVTDFSPLSDCPALNNVRLDLIGSREADLSRFCPPKLKELIVENGHDLSAIDLTGLTNCPVLYTATLHALPLDSLSCLSGAKNLNELHLYGLEGLASLSGLEGTNLSHLEVIDSPNLADIDPLSACQRLRIVQLSGVDRLRDVSVLGGLPHLDNISIWGARLSNLDFLRELSNQWGLNLGLGYIPADSSGLEAIGSFATLDIGDNFAAALPYLEGKTVHTLTIYNGNGLDLSALPRVTGELILCNCDIRDLVGLGAQSFSKLILEDCPYLRSLAGTEALEKLIQLEIRGCPRLTDWSALEGRTFFELVFRGTYSLPDLGKLTFLSLTLESTADLEDLSCLDEVNAANAYTFSFRGLDQVASLQPLFRLHGDALEVPPQLQEQAAELVESGRFKSWSVVYPDGSWEPDTGDVTLLSWEELETLPKSVLKRVRHLTLLGDVLVDWDTMDDDTDWSTEPPAILLTDRETGEQTRIDAPGTRITDFSLLSALTGLHDLDLRYQPLTSLAGIETLEDLEWLTAAFCPDLKDVSAAFTLQGLKQINFERCPVSSLQGVQNLYDLEQLEICNTHVTSLAGIEGLRHLTTVRVSGTNITDFSPLEQVDFSYAAEQGGVYLALDVRNGDDLPDDAFAFLANVPAISRLEVFNMPARLWYDYVLDRPVRSLAANASGFTQEQFDAFAAAQPGLESLSIPYNEGITDVSALLASESLRDLWLSQDMTEAIASLGDGYGFELHIDR